MDLELFSLVCGIISVVAVAGSMLFKNIKLTLLINLICNVAGAMPYLVKGEISACGLYFVAAAQCIVFIGYRLFKKEPPKYYTGVFAAMFILVSVLGFQKPLDILAMFAAVTCALALAQKTSTMYRVIMVANGGIWLVFDILSKTYDMVPAHIVTVAAALFGILKLDLGLFGKKDNKNEKGTKNDKSVKKDKKSKNETEAEATAEAKEDTKAIEESDEEAKEQEEKTSDTTK